MNKPEGIFKQGIGGDDRPQTPAKVSGHDGRELPATLRCETHRVKMGCGNLYVIVNTKFGEPVQVFLKLGKAGQCQCTLLQAAGRLVSIALQHDAPPEKIIKT